MMVAQFPIFPHCKKMNAWLTKHVQIQWWKYHGGYRNCHGDRQWKRAMTNNAGQAWTTAVGPHTLLT